MCGFYSFRDPYLLKRQLPKIISTVERVIHRSVDGRFGKIFPTFNKATSMPFGCLLDRKDIFSLILVNYFHKMLINDNKNILIFS